MNLLRLRPFFAMALLFVCGSLVFAQQPNTNSAYRQLRNLLPGSAPISVGNVVLKRDAAVFTLIRGQVIFYGEVNGKVTGAVFEGQGHFHLTPPNAIERHNLQILTKKDEFDEDFTQMVLRFTDGTAAELHKDGTAAGGGGADASMIRAAQEFHTFQRLQLQQNIDLRLLEDVLSPAPGEFFLAEMKGSADPHLLYEIDPHGAMMVAPEEVVLGSWNQWGWTFPSAFHLSTESVTAESNRQENAAFQVDSEELDTTIEKSGFLSGLATVHLHAREDGVAAVELNLFPTLRVSKAEGEHGEVLDFVQEKKEEDSDFGLVLAHPLKKGETAVVKITYGGKDAVQNVGNDNYNPVARESWFPNGGVGFGGYTLYKMSFHTPKDLELIATGNKLHDEVNGKTRNTEWDSKIPLPVVGFHLGKFKEKDGKTTSGVAVAAYANTELPDWAASIAQAANGGGVPQSINPGGGTAGGGEMAVGNMNTVSMLPVELSQGMVAEQLYETYFGKLSFDHIALTQQPACNYGQSWPMLVYLPICGFWDSTIQNQFHLNPADPYWKVVTAHEVAHQWWGHTVGFESYRDQWMSEGFADASAAIFLQATRKNNGEFLDFWKQLKTQLTERNAYGFRPIDVGPVTMGLRLSSPKTGWNIYQSLVYPKGAYILHMLRMMMWQSKGGDAEFISMMKDFVDTYRLKVATTEDFKAIVEKHMTPEMDLDRNHRMDWFFNEYVYGTELPTYHFENELTSDDTKMTLHFKLTQSGVSDSFKMLVPIYIELADGRQIMLGRIGVKGNTAADKSVNMEKGSIAVKHVAIDSMHDVLAIDK